MLGLGHRCPVGGVILPAESALPPLPTGWTALVPSPNSGNGALVPMPGLGHAGETEPASEVVVSDPSTLDLARAVALKVHRLFVRFTDPTWIPLEILLAEVRLTRVRVIVHVETARDAAVALGTLERGAHGVAVAGEDLGRVAEVMERVAPSGTGRVDLVPCPLTRLQYVGMGERACVDTAAYLSLQEGVLVGSFSRGLFLVASETHPLPYMPTRPFRFNAGAVHSYTLLPRGRTAYLSELYAGSEILAVSVDGHTRGVAVGRVKIERRPLLLVEAETPEGQLVSVILQADWHIRLFGENGQVRNLTDLRPGERVLVHPGCAARHVGIPVDEFCLEA